jgi:hypothetical protein
MAEDDMAVPEKLMEELGKQQQGRRWTRSCVGLVLEAELSGGWSVVVWGEWWSEMVLKRREKKLRRRWGKVGDDHAAWARARGGGRAGRLTGGAGGSGWFVS